MKGKTSRLRNILLSSIAGSEGSLKRLSNIEADFRNSSRRVTDFECRPPSSYVWRNHLHRLLSPRLGRQRSHMKNLVRSPELLSCASETGLRG
jgi:hypothetical protein